MPHTNDVHLNIRPKRYPLEVFLYRKQDTAPAARSMLPERMRLLYRLTFAPQLTAPEVYLVACTESQPSVRIIGRLLDTIDEILT
jgi:hypothetical protein